MPTQPHELYDWLGPAREQLTDEQIERLCAETDRIEARHPGPDGQDLRDAAMSAAVQYLLGETTIESAGRALTLARLAEDRAMSAAKQVAAMSVADGMPVKRAAERVGIDRMTLLGVLGKR